MLWSGGNLCSDHAFKVECDDINNAVGRRLNTRSDKGKGLLIKPHHADLAQRDAYTVQRPGLVLA